MKREELKYFYATDGEVGTMPLLHNCFVYPKEDVDRLLDDKDAEIEDLLRQNRELCQALQVMYSKEEYGKLQNEISELKAKLETVNDLVKASRDMMDNAIAANSKVSAMRERRLRRALWLARAERAKEMCQRLLIQGFDPKWENVERKCRKKAVFYL